MGTSSSKALPHLFLYLLNIQIQLLSTVFLSHCIIYQLWYLCVCIRNLPCIQHPAQMIASFLDLALQELMPHPLSRRFYESSS